MGLAKRSLFSIDFTIMGIERARLGKEQQLTEAAVAKANADRAAVMGKINGMTSTISSLADLSSDDALVAVCFTQIFW